MAREAATSLELRIEEHGQSNMEGDKFSELPFPGRILNSRTNVFPLISGGKVALNRGSGPRQFNATFPPGIKEKTFHKKN